MSTDFIILAGGTGSRTLSNTPKFLQEIAGLHCISYIINTCKNTNIYKNTNIIIVTKPETAKHKAFSTANYIAIQKKPLGTADALKCALPFIQSDSVIVMCSDTPLITSEILEKLDYKSGDISIIAMKLPHSLLDAPYGRVIKKDGITRIIEYKNASNEEKLCHTANTGIYKINTKFLKNNLDKIEQDSLSKEYYLTDILPLTTTDINVIISEDYELFQGINTMAEIAIVEKIMQNRLRKQIMDKGVKLLDPDTTYFSHDTHIEKDVIIEQNVIIKKNVKIKSGAIIKAFTYLEDCIIEENSKVGPFARIRGNSRILNNTIVGNFVEIKKSSIGDNSKIKHLSYIGDAEIKNNVNIGAGTITCNYNGINKYKTTIKENTMVGANSSLIAPLTIGKNSLIAAGSVITNDVPDNTKAFGRARQENKKNKTL